MSKLFAEMRGALPSNPALIAEAKVSDQFKWIAADMASLKTQFNVIDVEVEANVLTVAAERRWARAEGDQVLAAERRHGALRRQLVLGDTLDGSRLTAAYADGVLTLTIPMAETAKPRKVAVASGAPASAIEASVVDEAPAAE